MFRYDQRRDRDLIRYAPVRSGACFGVGFGSPAILLGSDDKLGGFVVLLSFQKDVVDITFAVRDTDNLSVGA